METDDVLTGEVGRPTQPPSGQPAQPSAIDYTALAKALEPSLAQLVEKQWQSGKDKRIAELTGKVDGFQSQLERYLQYAGAKLDPAALRQLKIDALLEQQTQGETAGAVSPATGGQATLPGQASVDLDTLQTLDLDPNSPEVAELLRKNAPLSEYVGLVKRRKAKANVSPAAVQPTGSGSTVVGDDAEILTAELSKLMANPSANFSRIKEINKKLDNLRKQPK